MCNLYSSLWEYYRAYGLIRKKISNLHKIWQYNPFTIIQQTQTQTNIFKSTLDHSKHTLIGNDSCVTFYGNLSVYQNRMRKISYLWPNDFTFKMVTYMILLIFPLIRIISNKSICYRNYRVRSSVDNKVGLYFSASTVFPNLSTISIENNKNIINVLNH